MAVKQLTTTPQTNGTTQTAANSGWTANPTIGASGTATFQTGAANGAPAGYRFTQSGAGMVFAYLDTTAAWTDFYMLTEFEWATTPTANVNFLRQFGDTGHSDNRGGLTLTTANRMQYVEGPASGLNVATPSGTPFTPGTTYVMDLRYKGSNETLLINFYVLGSTTLFLSLSGTLVHASVDINAIRWGIATASSLTQLDFNSNFKISDAPIARTDVSNSLPTANAGSDQTIDAGAPFTLQGAGTDSDGTIVGHTWSQTSGTTTALTGSSTGARTGVGPTTLSGATLVYSLLVTDNDGGVSASPDTVTVTVRPAPYVIRVGGVDRVATTEVFKA